MFDRGTVHTVPTTAVYTAYSNAAGAAAGGRQTLTTGKIIDLGGGVTLKCLATDGEVFGFGTVSKATSSENDLSSAWLLTFNEFKYYTGGDCGGESSAYADLETPIAQASSIGQVDAFKVNHHGSAYSSNQTFLNTLKPSAAFFLVGDGNSYLHPVQDVFNRVAAGGCYLYLTETGNGGTIPTGKGVIANGNLVLSTTGHNTFTVTYGTKTDSYALHSAPQLNITVSVNPTSASLSTGATKQFTATVTGGTTNAYTWSCTGGTVTSGGLYTTPATAGTYTVKATSSEDPSKSASATVTVTAASVVSVAITPTAVSISAGKTQQFTATLSGTTNTSVTWSCTGGTVSPAGLFTAPTTAGTYTVKATSAADMTKSASATVTVTATTSPFSEVESNNTIATANVVPVTVTTIVGYFPSSSDNDDYFAVTVAAGRTLTVSMVGPTASSQDYDLYLYNSSGTQLAKSENSGTTEQLSYKNTGTTTKTFYINVHRYSSYSSVTPYTLTLSR